MCDGVYLDARRSIGTGLQAARDPRDRRCRTEDHVDRFVVNGAGPNLPKS